jgi:hypothetical protein
VNGEGSDSVNWREFLAKHFDRPGSGGCGSQSAISLASVGNLKALMYFLFITILKSHVPQGIKPKRPIALVDDRVSQTT